MFEKNTGSGILQQGWDFRQMLEMAPGHQGDLSFIGWALKLDQVKVHKTRYLKNVWCTMVIPGKTTSPRPISWYLSFQIKISNFYTTGC